MSLKELVIDLASGTKDAYKNFALAEEYERLKQHSSAAGFFLRAADLGYKTDPLLTYTSLLKMALCWSRQQDRSATVLNTLHHAIAFMPSRPEAYFLLARFYEYRKEWQKAYTFSEVGLQFVHTTLNNPLPGWVEYHGAYCLMFEKAVSGWWIGRKEESRDLFQHLLDDHKMTQDYVNGCLNNMRLFN
jgi:tetratricopeptide (TPR) repeat protein